MKPWMDLQSVAISECMAHLPKDVRGYPIPFTVNYDKKGKPQFPVIDMEKWEQCTRFRLCGVTGSFLGKGIAFVGGLKSLESRCYMDPAMIPEAAEYAAQVCPFIAAPKFGYRKHTPEETEVIKMMSTDRPDTFAIGYTDGYQIHRYADGSMVLQANPFTRATYWRHGKQIEHPGA